MWHGYAKWLIHKWYVTMQLTTGPCTARTRIYLAGALMCDMSISYVMFQNAVYYRPSRSSHTHVYDMAHWCLPWLIRTWYVTILFTTGPMSQSYLLQALAQLAYAQLSDGWHHCEFLEFQTLGQWCRWAQGVLQSVAECWRVLQCVAVWCSVLQCVAVCCRVV